MVHGTQDKTLQAHRGSYKTTCVSIALLEIIILYPNIRVAFIRKTDTAVKEIIAQVSKMLKTELVNELVRMIWGVNLFLIKDNATEIQTNLTDDPRGASQLTGMGIKGTITGQHYDLVFTDDIVTLEDRYSKAERDKTMAMYQELVNIKNRGGREFNTGTPWHPDDCFKLMPNIEKHDCYETGLISEQNLQELRDSMLPSLFAANYELRHIASEDVIFTNPQTGADPAIMEQCNVCHIDAAYGGADFTAFTMCQKKEGKYYIFGKLWHKHVDDCMNEIIRYRKQFNAGRIYNENNGDKGYLSKALLQKKERPVSYHEDMNKFIKITTYLKGAWKNVIFVAGTDEDYIRQITDYTEEAEHDDAPDSCASAIRLLWNKKDEVYKSPFGVL